MTKGSPTYDYDSDEYGMLKCIAKNLDTLNDNLDELIAGLKEGKFTIGNIKV